METRRLVAPSQMRSIVLNARRHQGEAQLVRLVPAYAGETTLASGELESRRPSTSRRETLVDGTEERSDVRAHRTTRARIRPPLVSLGRSSAGEGSAWRPYSMLGAPGFPDGDKLQRCGEWPSGE